MSTLPGGGVRGGGAEGCEVILGSPAGQSDGKEWDFAESRLQNQKLRKADINSRFHGQPTSGGNTP